MLAICLALMGILTACLFGFAYLAESAATAAILGVTGFAPLAFSFLIGEETLAAFRLRIDIGKQVVRLRLPRRRGHVRLPAIEATVPLAAISAIETRAEAFVQLGYASIQQSWRIRLTDGRTIDLGADRQMKREIFGAAAAEIVRRTGLRVVRRGRVEGRAGVLAAYGTAVPDWSHSAVSDEALADRVAETGRVWRLTEWLMVLAQLVRLIGRR